MRALATGWSAFLGRELEQRAEAGLLRELRPLARDRASVVTDDGRRLVDFSSNDYLGLSSHPAVTEAAARAARGRAGATAARLIVGTDPASAALEEKLAAFQGTEAALVFGSGYLANLGTIACLVGPGDAVFSDRLNHASIVDGCRLSRATRHVYAHCDLDELEALLAGSNARRKLIVTESVFGMDGDVAPLAEMVELKARYGAALLVDEAHADGVFGPGGRGYAQELGVAEHVDLHLGTFGKAFGAYGAYVAGSAHWIRYLVNAARSFVFTTALPPPVVAAVDAALDVVREADGLRRRLHENADRLRAGLRELGLDARGETQIVPLIVGDNDAAIELARGLDERGVLAVAIRPPTVPVGTARIRFSASAAHRDRDVDRAISTVRDALVVAASTAG